MKRWLTCCCTSLLSSCCALVLAVAGCGSGSVTQATQAIVGGQPVDGTYPAVVALMVRETAGLSLRCSAVLVAPNAVLTGAHCLGAPLADLRVAFGDDVADPAQVLGVAEQQPHPLFVGTGNPPPTLSQANDLALLRLTAAVETIDPVPLLSAVEGQALQSGQAVQIVGFGATVPGGATGAKTAAESARIAELGTYELRISQPADPQACDGDSGGPALIQTAGSPARLVGVVSRAIGELCDQGAFYTRIDAYGDFVADLVALPCGSGPRPPCGDRPASSGDAGGGDADVDVVIDAGGSSGVGSGRGGQPQPISDDGGCALNGKAPATAPLLPLLLPLLLLGLRFGRSNGAGKGRPRR